MRRKRLREWRSLPRRIRRRRASNEATSAGVRRGRSKRARASGRFTTLRRVADDGRTMYTFDGRVAFSRAHFSASRSHRSDSYQFARHRDFSSWLISHRQTARAECLRIFWDFFKRSTLCRPPPMMLKARVIPCLDVKDGRVVKGVNFVDLRDAGDPVDMRDRLRRGGRRRIVLPRHHREPRGPRHPARRRAPHGRGVLHAADGRRRRAHDRGHPPVCCSPAPTRPRSIPPRCRIANSCARRRRNSAANASSSPSTPSEAVATAALGDLHPWRAPAHRPRRDRLCARGRRARRGRNPADLDGSRRHESRASTSSSPARSPTRSRFR